MLDESKVSALMRDVLLDIPGISEDDVRFQNRPFATPTPERGVFWIDEQQVVVSEVLAATEQVTVIGFTLYQVYVAMGTSIELQRDTTLAIAEAFRPGQWLRDVDGVPTDCQIQIWRTQRQTAFGDSASEAWYVQPVQVNWRAHVPNPAQF